MFCLLFGFFGFLLQRGFAVRGCEREREREGEREREREEKSVSLCPSFFLVHSPLLLPFTYRLRPWTEGSRVYALDIPIGCCFGERERETRGQSASQRRSLDQKGPKTRRRKILLSPPFTFPQERAGLFHVSHIVRVTEPALGAVLLRGVGGARGHGLGLCPPVGVESSRRRSSSRRSIIFGGTVSSCSCSAKAPGAADDASFPSRGRTTGKQRAPRVCRHEHASAFESLCLFSTKWEKKRVA